MCIGQGVPHAELGEELEKWPGVLSFELGFRQGIIISSII